MPTFPNPATDHMGKMNTFSGRNAKPTLYSDKSGIAACMMGADSVWQMGDPERVKYK